MKKRKRKETTTAETKQPFHHAWIPIEIWIPKLPTTKTLPEKNQHNTSHLYHSIPYRVLTTPRYFSLQTKRMPSPSPHTSSPPKPPHLNTKLLLPLTKTTISSIQEIRCVRGIRRREKGGGGGGGGQMGGEGEKKKVTKNLWKKHNGTRYQI